MSELHQAQLPHSGDASVLASFPVLDSRDAEQVRDFVAPKSMQLDFVSHTRQPELHAQINAAHLPNFYMAFVRYGAEVSVNAPGLRPDFQLSLPLVGGFELGIGSRTYTGGRDHATLASPNHDQITRLGIASERLSVCVTHSAMVDHLEMLLGETLTAPLEFTPGVSLTTPGGSRLRRAVDGVVAQLNEIGHEEFSPLAQTEFEEWLIGRILTDTEHNYSAPLAGRHPPPPPRTVRRAVDFLEASGAHGVTLADLVAVTGIPGRTLNEHFRNATGVSPLTYLRRVRLARVRAELRVAGPGTTVSAIAARWGFAHAGRFSAEYKRLYGEQPRKTLRNPTVG